MPLKLSFFNSQCLSITMYFLTLLYTCVLIPQLYSLFYIYSPDKMSAIIYVDYWLCNKMQPKESLM